MSTKVEIEASADSLEQVLKRMSVLEDSLSWIGQLSCSGVMVEHC